MMSSLIHVLVQIRTIYSNRYQPEYARMFVDVYWRALLLIACGVIGGASLYGGLLFFDVLSDLNATTPASASVPQASTGFSRIHLDTTLKGFAIRKESFDALQKGSIVPIEDPSK